MHSVQHVHLPTLIRSTILNNESIDRTKRITFIEMEFMRRVLSIEY